MKNILKFIIVVSILAISVFACNWQDIDFSDITWNTQSSQAPCDSTGCYIWAPGKSYTSPTLARIWENTPDTITNSNWTVRDTFFFQDSLFGDPYLLLASYLQVPDSLVCTMVTFQNGVLSIPTGRIYYDSTFTSNSFAIIVDTVDHPFFQQSFLKRCE